MTTQYDTIGVPQNITIQSESKIAFNLWGKNVTSKILETIMTQYLFQNAFKITEDNKSFGQIRPFCFI